MDSQVLQVERESSVWYQVQGVARAANGLNDAHHRNNVIVVHSYTLTVQLPNSCMEQGAARSPLANTDSPIRSQ